MWSLIYKQLLSTLLTLSISPPLHPYEATVHTSSLLATNDGEYGGGGGFCSLEMAVQSSRNITETARQHRERERASDSGDRETVGSYLYDVQMG